MPYYFNRPNPKKEMTPVRTVLIIVLYYHCIVKSIYFGKTKYKTYCMVKYPLLLNTNITHNTNNLDR